MMGAFMSEMIQALLARSLTFKFIVLIMLKNRIYLSFLPTQFLELEREGIRAWLRVSILGG